MRRVGRRTHELCVTTLDGECARIGGVSQLRSSIEVCRLHRVPFGHPVLAHVTPVSRAGWACFRAPLQTVMQFN